MASFRYFFSSFVLLVTLLTLGCRNVICQAALNGCELLQKIGSGYSLAGDITLGGLFAVHMEVEYPELSFKRKSEPLRCSTFHIRYYRFLLSMVYSTAQINMSPDILPNVTLGFKLYDSCYNEVKSLIGTTWLLSGKKNIVPNFNCHMDTMPPAIIGDMPSKATIPVARLLGLYKYPQVSYAAAHPILSDKTQFPSFFRTISNDNYEVFAIAKLVKHFNWTWVGIITSDNELGRSGTQLLTKEIERGGGCIAFLETLPIFNSIDAVYRIVEVIDESKATVIIVYSTIENLISLMEKASYHNITDKVWVGCGSWSITSDFPRRDILTTLNGSLGLIPQTGKIPGFKEFLYSIHPSKFPEDIFITTFWEKAFGCFWPKDDFLNYTDPETVVGAHWCTGDEELDSIDPNVYDVYNFRYSYKVHNAVMAIAHALHQMNLCVPGKGPFKNGSCANIYNHQPFQLLHYVKNVKFNNPAGDDIFFDENGDVPLYADILNWQLFPNGSNWYVHVGRYDARSPEGHELTIDRSKIVWNVGGAKVPISVCSNPCPQGQRRAMRQGQKICCFDCVPCSEGEILNPDDDSKCLMCPEDMWPNPNKETCVPKPVQFLSFQESLGSSLACIAVICCVLTFSVLCLFIVKHKTPIVKANNRELSYLLLVSLMLCFLCSLAFIGKPNKSTCMVRQVMFGVIFSICLSVILTKTITVIMVFSATNPDSKLKKLVGLKIPLYIIPCCTMVQIVICIVWLSTSGPFTQFNMTAEIGTIVVECNEGSVVLFSCVMGYMGLLATISLLVAFLARKLPDTFNEAKYIAFSMVVFASVWLTFIPAYLSTKGKYMVAVEVFAILSSSSGLLSCIFFPKCYLILLQPETNTKEFITRRKRNSRLSYKVQFSGIQ